MSDIMDEQGFIFTTDSILALVVVMVFTASIVTYGLLPIYQGEEHQHLQALADSVLETMEQDGTLRDAAVQYSLNNTPSAQNILLNELNVLVPDQIGYKMTVANWPYVSNGNGFLTSSDIATKVKVISGPQEGWVGRAYYKQDEVEFQDITSTAVTTVWNFHNYLKNFGPWSSGLNTYNYWGGTNARPQANKPIQFVIPGPVNSAKFLLGSAAGSGQTKSYAADVVLNGVNHNYIANSSFFYIYNSAGVGPIYNYPKNLSAATLNNGLNNFFVQFNATSNQNMPWFSLIANYTTTLSVPKGIANDTITFPDIAGVGRPGPGNTGILYNLDTGALTATPGRTISWATLQSSDYDTSTPFVLTGMPNIPIGSAVASTQDVYLPPGNKLFDAYTVVNAYGGEDGAIVQVKDSTGVWNTAFASFSTTARTDGGYGNVPGIINIQPYLTYGHNTVRIITWDNVPGNDYDLVGLESCYSKITYSKFPIRWDTYPFDSYQNHSNTQTQKVTESELFRVDPDAQSALLFAGTGIDTRNITVTLKSITTGTSSQLYNGPVPYVLNLGDLDKAKATHILATNILPNGSYTLKPDNFTLTVSVSPSDAYESGDGASSPPTYGYDADPEIFSGTRISVIYPKFLQNIYNTTYASTPEVAAQNAVKALYETLNTAGISNINASLVRNDTFYTGDVPSAYPVRLDLWRIGS